MKQSTTSVAQIFSMQMALALIDDTGDPGTAGAGRPWFSWVGLVVPENRIDVLKSLRDDVSGKLRGQGGAPKPKGWDEAIHGDNLIGVLRALRHLEGWAWLAVASYTPMSSPETARHIHVPTDHRYYTLLFLLERLSWIGEAWDEVVTAFVEAPKDRNFIQSELRKRHENGLPHSKAKYQFLPSSRIFVATEATQPLLNVAHCVALGFGKAINPHERWGQPFPEYIEIVRENLWVGPTRDGASGLTDIGITILPYDQRFGLEGQLSFIRKWWVEHFAALLGRN